MEFALGVIVGLLLALLAVATLTFFRTQVEKVTKIVQKKVEQVGPRPKGGIYLPDDEGTVARKEIIKENKEAGKDTPVSDLL